MNRECDRIREALLDMVYADPSAAVGATGNAGSGKADSARTSATAAAGASMGDVARHLEECSECRNYAGALADIAVVLPAQQDDCAAAGVSSDWARLSSTIERGIRLRIARERRAVGLFALTAAGILAAMALMSLFFSWNDPLGREVHWGPDAVAEVGFRAHQLEVATGIAGRHAFHATVTVTEITGSESFVHLNRDASNWVAVLQGVHEFEPGHLLDAVLDDALGSHQRRTLANVPHLLEQRFKDLAGTSRAQVVPTQGTLAAEPQGTPADMGATLKELLLAELGIRLQPIDGMMEALGNITTGQS